MSRLGSFVHLQFRYFIVGFVTTCLSTNISSRHHGFPLFLSLSLSASLLPLSFDGPLSPRYISFLVPSSTSTSRPTILHHLSIHHHLAALSYFLDPLCPVHPLATLQHPACSPNSISPFLSPHQFLFTHRHDLFPFYLIFLFLLFSFDCTVLPLTTLVYFILLFYSSHFPPPPSYTPISVGYFLPLPQLSSVELGYMILFDRG